MRISNKEEKLKKRRNNNDNYSAVYLLSSGKDQIQLYYVKFVN
jgi:hypothetical protein